jgi:DUF971 family protein
MSNNRSNLDDITLRYADTSSRDDLRVSYHTKKDVFVDVSLGDTLDFVLPSAEVINIDTLPNGEYNVIIEFDNEDDMMDFIWTFASIELSKRESNLEKYKEQRRNAVLSDFS